MKTAENVLLRQMKPPHEIVLECSVGDIFICPTLFGWDKCAIKEIKEDGSMIGDNQYSIFMLEKVENGIRHCLQVDKKAIESCDFR